jgi:outer membrane protein OmpA-like peptidoglycan-associated protein
MTEGYGADGRGTHFAVPSGVPGSDCVVNPVSFNQYVATEIARTWVSVETVKAGDVFTIPANVLFDFDKDFLRPEGKQVLTDLANKLVELGVKEMTVIGHTDAKGTDEYNLDLGQRRSETVVNYMASLGVDVTLVAESRGEFEPVAPNEVNGRDNPAGRQLNRRVDLRVDRTEVVVQTRELVETEVEVLRDRNPQVFHVLSSGNQVYCGADQIPVGLFFWR